jgi:hypothetical protein
MGGETLMRLNLFKDVYQEVFVVYSYIGKEFHKSIQFYKISIFILT